MKYPAHWYAKSLVEVALDAAAKDDAKMAERFRALLEKNNDAGALRKILEEAGRIARGRRGIRKVVFESARPLTAAQRKTLGAVLSPEDVVQERVDPALVAGVRIIIDDEMLFDGSFKGKLDAIFTA
jgi:F0F1-type ATP synthase delta subunit